MDRPRVRYFVQGEGVMNDAPDWPPPDATPSTFYLSGAVASLNDGSLVAEAQTVTDGETSWSYPAPEWMAEVTTFDKDGTPDHIARVNTFTSAPFDRDREFTGQGVLILYASSDQTDMDIMVKLSLLSEGDDKPHVI